MNLQPQNNFTVVRQIANHLDSDTNYVKAVIRNAYTDAIIDTLQLTDKGGQRFKKDWQAPADPSGQGFYISIVTSVYTDSGYTTKNPNYGDEEQTYLVMDRLAMNRGGGGGLDSATTRRIVAEELDKTAPVLDKLYGAIGALQREINRIPKDQPKGRWGEILKAINAIDTKASNIEQKEPDLTKVLASLEDVKKAVADKEVTEPTDLTPVLERLQKDSENDAVTTEEIKSLMQGMEATLTSAIEESTRKAIDETAFVSTFTTKAQPSPASTKPRLEPPFDHSRLSI